MNIYTSKFYQASKPEKKRRIQSAFNTLLVSQPPEDIKEIHYKSEPKNDYVDNDTDVQDEELDAETKEVEPDDSEDGAKSITTKPSPVHFTPNTSKSSATEDSSSEEPVEKDESTSVSDDSADKPSDTESESTAQSKSPSLAQSKPAESENPKDNAVDSSTKITADINTTNTSQESIKDVALNDVSQIAGTLNLNEATAGVKYVRVKHTKQDEVWIYYQDSVNLTKYTDTDSSVMEKVIELLQNTNYNYLIFNRVARADNALVFDIDETDIKPIEGITTG